MFNLTVGYCFAGDKKDLPREMAYTMGDALEATPCVRKDGTGFQGEVVPGTDWPARDNYFGTRGPSSTFPFDRVALVIQDGDAIKYSQPHLGNMNSMAVEYLVQQDFTLFLFEDDAKEITSGMYLQDSCVSPLFFPFSFFICDGVDYLLNALLNFDGWELADGGWGATSFGIQPKEIVCRKLKRATPMFEPLHCMQRTTQYLMAQYASVAKLVSGRECILEMKEQLDDFCRPLSHLFNKWHDQDLKGDQPIFAMIGCVLLFFCHLSFVCL